MMSRPDFTDRFAAQKDPIDAFLKNPEVIPLQKGLESSINHMAEKAMAQASQELASGNKNEIDPGDRQAIFQNIVNNQHIVFPHNIKKDSLEKAIEFLDRRRQEQIALVSDLQHTSHEAKSLMKAIHELEYERSILIDKMPKTTGAAAKDLITKERQMRSEIAEKIQSLSTLPGLSSEPRTIEQLETALNQSSQLGKKIELEAAKIAIISVLEEKCLEEQDILEKKPGPKA